MRFPWRCVLVAALIGGLVVLVAGFSRTGKSAVALLVAQSVGWHIVENARAQLRLYHVHVGLQSGSPNGDCILRRPTML